MCKQPLAGHAEVDAGYAETEEVVVGPLAVGQLVLAEGQLVAAAGVRVVGGNPGEDGIVGILQFQEKSALSVKFSSSLSQIFRW